MEQYVVTGMTCAACQARVEKAVMKVDGVSSCSVSLLTNSMGVEGTATAQAIIDAVEQAGYGASLKNTGEHTGREEHSAGSFFRQAGGRRGCSERPDDAHAAQKTYRIRWVSACINVSVHGTYDAGASPAFFF